MKVRFAVAPQNASLTATGLLGFTEALEDSDFDGIWLSDLPIGPALDPLLALALAAGRTSRLRLGANLVPLGRNPYLLAKQLAQLDQLSDGRLLLSLVTGLGRQGEREALGLEGAGRGSARCLAGRPWAAGARSGRPRRRWLAGSSAHPRRDRGRTAAHPGSRGSCRSTAGPRALWAEHRLRP